MTFSSLILAIDRNINELYNCQNSINRRILIAISIVITGFVAFIAAIFVFSVILFQLGLSIEREPPIEIKILIPIFLFLFGVFIGLIVVYYYFPEMRSIRKNRSLEANAKPIDIVKYISNNDEVQVIDAIEKMPQGAYQFEIAGLSGLSRMKVHRVVKRLLERDILVAKNETHGKNKKIYLSDWIS